MQHLRDLKQDTSLCVCILVFRAVEILCSVELSMKNILFVFKCLVIALWLFLTMARVCLQFIIVVFPDHTHLLLL